jgi:serine/threonine-protein kinase
MPDSEVSLVHDEVLNVVCSSCGQALGEEADLASVEPTPVTAPAVCSPVGPPSVFAPGTLLAERYRIVAPLGSGGGGEVFRADDLILNHPVALKLFAAPSGDERATLDRFYQEVRMARQISHGNVCRVFDIGETAGRPFITMEFVGGEDLHLLLRRIGRLSPDKALQVSRQLCAGLAAAHDAGVLHRDLKPANIMLDARGNVKIADFGLAALAGDRSRDAQAGTPGYMAPEQLAGKEVTARSDLYALGLVLYELFTGKRALEPQSATELVRGSVRRASRLDPMPGVHLLVQQTIWHCLETNPAKRPASAAHVAAVLSQAARLGPVPVAQKVAAPTPVPPVRPQLPRLAWSIVGSTLAGSALMLLLAPWSTGVGLTFSKSPSGSLPQVFTWMWCLGLQSFVTLVALAFVLRAERKARRTDDLPWHAQSDSSVQ